MCAMQRHCDQARNVAAVLQAEDVKEAYAEHIEWLEEDHEKEWVMLVGRKYSSR
jgi:hypothetical protein